MHRCVLTEHRWILYLIYTPMCTHTQTRKIAGWVWKSHLEESCCDVKTLLFITYMHKKTVIACIEYLFKLFFKKTSLNCYLFYLFIGMEGWPKISVTFLWLPFGPNHLIPYVSRSNVWALGLSTDELSESSANCSHSAARGKALWPLFKSGGQI